MASGRSRCRRLRQMGLPQWRHVPRKKVPLSEIGERQPRSLIGRCSTRNQFPPAVIEMLLEFFDDFGLTARRET
jgi:hypothetical protein